MITARRDYLMRVLEEVGRWLARLSAKRRNGDTDDSDLEVVVMGLQRLFGLEAAQVFLLTPDQQFDWLCREDDPYFARDQVLAYAALNAEAGYAYRRQGKEALARATFLNALRFLLKAQLRFSPEGWPAYAPSREALQAELASEPLDSVTSELWQQVMAKNSATG